MNEYLFYYNEINPEKSGDDGSFIWYSRINKDNLADAIMEFTQFVGDEEQIIQIIIKNKLQ